MLLREIMKKDLVTVVPGTSVREAAKVLRDKNIGCILVSGNGSLKGLLTDRDIACWLAEGKDPDYTKVAEIMNKALTFCSPDTDIFEAAKIMASQNAAVYISILQASVTGTSVFNETHNITTTAQGLINLSIGSINDLSVVDFSSDIYFIEIIVNGTLMGTSQLLSVPYALQAKTAENVFSGNYNDLTNQPTVDLSTYLDNTDAQNLTLNGTTLEISGGTNADLSSLQDNVELIIL